MCKRASALLVSFLMLPLLAAAQGFSPDGGPLGDTLSNIIAFINAYLIPFILGIGFFFLVWGIFLYFIKGGAHDEDKAKGKSLLVYATAGFVIIFIFWGVVEMLATSTGFLKPTIDLPIPGFEIGN
jgi:hypothetical protein